MALQTSGAISLSQVQSEFGGANPISMSEYYRGGANVPTTVGGPAGAWSSYQGNVSTYYWYSIGTSDIIRWANVQKASGAYGTTVTAGGYEYQRGSLFTSTGGGGEGGPTEYYYRVRRRVAATSATVNTSVPASGAVSMNQFYGGRNT